MEIHDRIRKIIKDEDLSISEFERIIGAGPNTVSSCLRRQSSIGHKVLQGVAKMFPHYSIEWLVTGKESNNKEVVTRIKKINREMNQEINKLLRN